LEAGTNSRQPLGFREPASAARGIAQALTVKIRTDAASGPLWEALQVPRGPVVAVVALAISAVPITLDHYTVR
jgi:hypothetical protein